MIVIYIVSFSNQQPPELTMSSNITQFTATITKNRNVLCYTNDADCFPEYFSNFCGKTLDTTLNKIWIRDADVHYYLWGDIDFMFSVGSFSGKNVTIIKQRNGALSTKPLTNDGAYEGFAICTILDIPRILNGTGVYYQNIFKSLHHESIFAEIVTAHTFHSLTESNKPTNAFRKGVYLTKVECDMENGNTSYHYHLLRCSSNLGGGSEDLQTIDQNIINLANDAVKHCFDGVQTNNVLNHVLAQIYYNTTDENGKDKKAKIKGHSDKTKDMPFDGLIAFCTFYDRTPTTDAECARLRFCLKPDANTDENKKLAKKFDVVLQDSSMFVIPLSTNQLYTHEIVPSGLPAKQIPTRMGHVIRSSNVVATYKDCDEKTYINGIEMCVAKSEDVVELKNKYFEENTTSNNVDYGEEKYFSLNNGDYSKPIVR